MTASHVANNVPRGSRVLELGKDAKNLYYLTEPAAATLVIPPSSDRVKEGPIREAAAKLNLSSFALYTERPLDALPIRPASFDAALCADMLDGAPPMAAAGAVALLARSLRPSGRLIFVERSSVEMPRLAREVGGLQVEYEAEGGFDVGVASVRVVGKAVRRKTSRKKAKSFSKLKAMRKGREPLWVEETEAAARQDKGGEDEGGEDEGGEDQGGIGPADTPPDRPTAAAVAREKKVARERAKREAAAESAAEERAAAVAEKAAAEQATAEKAAAEKVAAERAEAERAAVAAERAEAERAAAERAAAAAERAAAEKAAAEKAAAERVAAEVAEAEAAAAAAEVAEVAPAAEMTTSSEEVAVLGASAPPAGPPSSTPSSERILAELARRQDELRARNEELRRELRRLKDV